MKAHLFVIRRKALANLFYQMGSIMRVIFKEIEFMGRVNLSIFMGRQSKECGVMADLLKSVSFDLLLLLKFLPL